LTNAASGDAATTPGMTSGPPARLNPPTITPEWAVGVVAALAAMAAGFFKSTLLDDGDVYWHVAAGRWILAHAQVPHVDPFSFTFAGAPWNAHEWLAEVFMAATFQLSGWTGVLVLFGAAMGAAVLLLAAYLRRWLPAPGLIVALGLTIGCARPTLLARPHLLVMPLVIGWAATLLVAREGKRAPHLATALIMLVWANVHGSFVFGFVLLAGLALEAVLEAAPTERVKAIRDWGVFGLASLVAAACNPQGIAGVLFPFRLMGMSGLGVIDEWRPSDFATLGPLEISLLVVLYLALTRGVRAQPVRILIVLGLLHMALQHARHLMIAAPLVAALLAEPFARAGPALVARQDPGGRGWRWGVAALVVVMLLGLRLALPVTSGDGRYTPKTALDHVPPSLLTQPVLNDYTLGGYLIFRGARPFIDGRTDLYGDAFMQRYLSILSGDPQKVDGALRQYAPAWTIFPPDANLVAQMDREPGWRRLYADKFAVVHVRVAPPTPVLVSP